jgi:hypothetical protein
MNVIFPALCQYWGGICKSDSSIVCSLGVKGWGHSAKGVYIGCGCFYRKVLGIDTPFTQVLLNFRLLMSNSESVVTKLSWKRLHTFYVIYTDIYKYTDNWNILSRMLGVVHVITKLLNTDGIRTCGWLTVGHPFETLSLRGVHWEPFLLWVGAGSFPYDARA